MRNLKVIASAVICGLFFIVACSDDPSSVQEDPPQVPPASSMQMDLSSFETPKTINGTQTQSVDNFARASLTAITLRTIVELNLAIPRALLTAANATDAELNEDENWEWSYTHTAGGSDYEVRLVASREGENTVNWEFYVTNSMLGLDDQLFFTGTTNNDGAEGEWSYYNLQNTESQEQVSQVDWTVNGEEDVELRLEVTSDRNENQGDYIDYTRNDSLKTAVYFDNSDDQETELQINVNTKAGYIIAPNYNNGEKACWDENFQDLSCSE